MQKEMTQQENKLTIKPEPPKYKQIEKGDTFTADNGNLLECTNVKELGNAKATGENRTNKVSYRTIIKEISWNITFPAKEDHEAERTITTNKRELVILKSDFITGKLVTRQHFKTKGNDIINTFAQTLEEDQKGILNKVLMKTNIDPIKTLIKGGEAKTQTLTEEEAIISATYQALKQANIIQKQEE